MAQPILSFKNFSNISDNGLFWCEGFAARRVNGQSVLSTCYGSTHTISEDTAATYANLNLASAINIAYGGGYIGTGQRFVSMWSYCGAYGRIFDFAGFFGNTVGEIHLITALLNSYCDYGDLYVTKNLNILYAGGDYLGIAYNGQATGLTSDTQIVDLSVRNFTTLGIVVGGFVYNFKTLENHTVTGVASVGGTNDALTFAAGGTVDATGDNFFAFADRGALNGGAYWNFFATTAYPHFYGQTQKNFFKRQIVLFDTDYLITNGNWLAALNVNETTWNDNFKQLPPATQSTCIAVNQQKILVGGDFYGSGKLLLWDGYSDGWLSILEFAQIPLAICAYGSGFVVLIGKYIYKTDGYTIQELASFPDLGEGGYLPYNAFFNQMKVIGEKIFLNLDFGSNNVFRNWSGLWVYEPGSGLVYVSAKNTGGFQSRIVTGALGINNTSSIIRLYHSYSLGQGSYGATQLYNIGSMSLDDYRVGLSTAVLFTKVDRPIKIARVGVVLQPKYNLSPYAASLSNALDETFDLSIHIGRGRDFFSRFFQSGAGSTTTVLKNSYGIYSGAKIGSAIRCEVGSNAGQIVYATSIANAGTVNEEITVYPALTNTPDDNTYFRINNTKKCEVKNLNAIALPDEVFFEANDMAVSTNIWLEIAFKPYTRVGIDILGINLY